MPSTSPPAAPFFSGQVRISAFWRKWYYFALALCITTGVGGLHFLLVTPTYQVTARILVEERGRPLGENPAERENPNFLPTHAEIISSPAVLTRAVESMKSPLPDDPEVSLIEAVLKRLEVRPLIGTHVLSITYKDASAEWAIDGLGLIISNYKQYLKETEQTSHQETILLLTERSDHLRDEIRVLQSEYEQLRADSPLLGEDHDSASIQRGMLTRLSEELMLTKSRRIALNNQLETLVAIRQGNDDRAVQMIALQPAVSETTRNRASIELLSRLSADGLLSGINPQVDLEALLQAELDYAELRKNYGAKHPDVLAVEERIQSLKSRLEEIVKVAPETIRLEADSLERQLLQLVALYQREFTQAKQVDQYLVREQQKRDEIELVKLAHDTIVAQLNELKVADSAVNGGRPSVSVRLLDGPELTDELVWPQPKPLLALCILAGLAGGAVLIVVTEKRRPAEPTLPAETV